MTPYTQDPSSTTPDWFVGDQVTTPPPGPSRGKKILIVVVILLLIGAIAVAIAISSIAATPQKPQCLDAAAYEAFTGDATIDAIDPTQNFFTFGVEFKSQSTDYNDAEPPKVADVLTALGMFYEQYSEIPQTYTITAPRANKADSALSNSRIDRLRASLLQEGIPAKNIVLVPLELPAETTISEDDDVGDVDLNTVDIKITSTQKCSE